MQEINWQELGDKFEDSSAAVILMHTYSELARYGEIVFLTAFGPEGCVLIDHLAKLRDLKLIDHQKIYIANLDTNYQFIQTLELAKELGEKYRFDIDYVQPALTLAQQATIYGKNLYDRDPDQCCFLRKLVPLHNLLAKKLAWITSIRREQTEHRAEANAFEFDHKFKLGKVNPLINWTKSDIWKYIHENKVPYNPLLDEGYQSIGCEPCTYKSDSRKGSRWAGKEKIECGLHLKDDELAGEFNI
jgi:phosphoadenosine phosphosulfate reductase